MNLQDVKNQSRMKEYILVLGDVGRSHLIANHEVRMLYDWKTFSDRRKNEACITMLSLGPELRYRCGLVNSLHALDAIADGKIPNSKFAENHVYHKC